MKEMLDTIKLGAAKALEFAAASAMTPTANFASMDGSIWLLFNGADSAGWVGSLPDIFRAFDRQDAAHQIADRYEHGGGYQPGFLKMKMLRKPGMIAAKYPDDPPLRLIAWTYLPYSEEQIMLFEAAMVAIVKGENVTWVRMD
jgi:hypothetical protein